MTAYFDSAVLVKVYCVEADSKKVIALLENYPPPLPLSHWQEIEIKTAFRLKLFRKELTAAECRQALAHLRSDINKGLLRRPSYDLEEVFWQAEKLSDRYAAAIGCRTLDILQIATALTVSARELITFDSRQAALAKKAGLKVKS